MSPLLLATVMLGQVCFTPSDARPGWKRVMIPNDAPRLAAPDGVDQYRSAEAYETVNEYRAASLAGWSGRMGKTEFELVPGAGACELEVEFTEPLRGAKVSMSSSGTSPLRALMPEKRQPGKTVRTKWGSDVPQVKVIVHDHFRKSPVIQRWKTVCTVPVNYNETQADRWLTYLQPVGKPVQLCERPGATMRVHGDPKTLGANVVWVTLTRT